MTTEEYYAKQAHCDDKCYVDEAVVENSASEMPCVTCPFCKEIVTAKLTRNTISCPACKIVVDR